MKSLPRILATLALGALGALGCQTVLGIHDVSRDPAEGSGGASGTASAAPDGSGGQGGKAEGGFTFAINAATVKVPYDGLSFLDIEVIRLGGFDSPIDVSVQGAPPGLVAKPLTIPAGSSAGKLEIGATTTLVLGTSFVLSLIATSGTRTQLASAPALVTGKPGTLDTAFGQAGIAAGPTSTGGLAFHDIREVAQGKILVGGVNMSKLGGFSMQALRLLPDGTLDTTFNGTGIVTSSYCMCTNAPQEIHGVAREVDGLMLFVGSGHKGSGFTEDIASLRLRDDGAFDVIQGDGGKNLADLGGEEHVTAVGLTTDQRIVVAGARDSQLFVARVFDRYGDIDTKFANPNGWLALDLGGTPSSATSLAIDATGRIVVTGWVETPAERDAVLVRLTPSGALDPTFGAGGVVKLPREGVQQAGAVALQPDGRIVIVAETNERGVRELLLLRFLDSGAPDPAFGMSGQVFASLGNSQDTSLDLALLLDGRILAAGNGAIGGVPGPVVARFLPDGTPDPTFGTAGVQPLFVGAEGALQSVTLTSDGKLLIAGVRESYPFKGYVARLWN